MKFETIVGRHAKNGETFSWILPAGKRERFYTTKREAEAAEVSVLALVETLDGFSIVEVVDHGVVLAGDHTPHKKAVFFYVGDPAEHIPNFIEKAGALPSEQKLAEQKICFDYLQSLGRRTDALEEELREWDWTRAYDILFLRENTHPVSYRAEMLEIGELPFAHCGRDEQWEVVCGLPGIAISTRSALVEKVGRSFFENLSRAVFAQQKLERVITELMRDYPILDSAWNSWSIGVRDRKFRIVATKYSKNEPLEEIDGSFISSSFSAEERKKILEFISYVNYFARSRFLWIDFVNALTPEQKEWYDHKMDEYENRECWPPRPRNIEWEENNEI
ncbi:hypothetical protein [uncultured Campylobacter sp.]|uniref:hypothetical protein n=1 Tax=uncultured Campylobacter sp. TaxID=218934 RepID=UPI00262F5084|nr:hypothetical protein [uncultured Campylobacter sp.]